MGGAPIVLVPGFWLGAWAFDEVAAALRADGLEVTSVTLPGLESVDADRSRITISDHVDAICRAVKAAGAPVVLVVHSGAGVPGYGASDRLPEQIAAMVYVDSAPATGALDPDLIAAEVPLPTWEELEADGSSLEGLTPEQLETFRRRAVPEPGAAIREAPVLNNAARFDVPSTVVCSSISSEQIKALISAGYNWLGGLAELHDVTYVDLPTSHWPMWSQAGELARIIGEVAKAHATAA